MKIYTHAYKKLYSDFSGALMERQGAFENWSGYITAEQRERASGNLKQARQFAAYRVDMENVLLQHDAAEGGNI